MDLPGKEIYKYEKAYSGVEKQGYGIPEMQLSSHTFIYELEMLLGTSFVEPCS